MKVAELFVDLGLNGANKVVGQLKGVLRGTMVLKDGLLGTISALDTISKSVRDYAMELDKFETFTGKSSEDLQRMSFMATQAGVSMGELSSVLQGFQRLKVNTQMGRGMPSAFMLLGINPNTDPVQMLSILKSKIGSLRPEYAKMMAEELGVSEEIFYMLAQSNVEFEQLNEKYVLTAKERKNMVKLNAEWNKFWFMLKQIGAKIQAVGGELNVKLLKFILRAVEGAGELITRFIKIIEANKNLAKIIGIVGAVLLAVFSPWSLVLAGVALILEDIFTYFEGGDSITGYIVEWAKNSEWLQDTITGVKDIFIAISNVVKLIVKGIKSISGFLNEHKWLKDILTDGLKGGISGVANMFNPIGMFGKMGREIGNIRNSVVVYAQGTNEEVGEEIARQISNTYYDQPDFGG